MLAAKHDNCYVAAGSDRQTIPRGLAGMTNRRRLSTALLFALATTFASLGCESSTAPKSILGTYTIITPVCCWDSGSGTPTTAAISLAPSWYATRRVVFRQSGGAQTATSESGRFELSHDTLTIHVRTDFTSDFRYHAVLSGDTLRVFYPNPADGPDLIELYVRFVPL